MNAQQKSDIIIVGAGFVGLTLAQAFAQQSKRVTLIEATTTVEKKEQHAEDGRALGLSIQSQRILEKLNIWHHIKDFARPMTEVHVSEQRRWGKLRLPVKGFVIPAPELGMQLLQLCQQNEHIVWQHASVSNVSTTDKAIIAHCHEKQMSFSAPLIILAQGSNTITHGLHPFSTKKRDYHQMAIVANVSVTHPTQQIAYQRFTKAGTLALLPLTGDRLTFVLSVHTENYPDWQALSDDELLEKLQSLFGYKLGRWHSLGTRYAYPLKALFVEKAYQERLLLMGNAAHTLHPIAAQGFNLTLRDIALLMDLLEDVDLCHGPAVENLLAQYQAKRLPNQKSILHFTDTLVDILEPSALKTMRSIGLFAMDSLPFVKQKMTRLLGAR